MSDWPELPPPPEGASGWNIYDVTDPDRPVFLQSTSVEADPATGERIEHPDDLVRCPRCGRNIPRRLVDVHIEMKCIRL